MLLGFRARGFIMHFFMKNIRKAPVICLLLLGICAFLFAVISVFFDQAVLVRKGTFYRANVSKKVIALTFDDGPSLEWTPKILDELKKAGIKATFFMVGKHIQEYPEVAKRLVNEGHDVGIHTFNHPVLVFSDITTLQKEITDTEEIIKTTTGKTTKLFRPPKAWLSKMEKERIRALGYKIVLWRLNSKDWVTFDDKYMARFIIKNVRPGDVILFHDSGGVFSLEGGNRRETVKVIAGLAEKLKQMGYSCITISELLKIEEENGNSKD